jgi:hypothetical protein
VGVPTGPFHSDFILITSVENQILQIRQILQRNPKEQIPNYFHSPLIILFIYGMIYFYRKYFVKVKKKIGGGIKWLVNYLKSKNANVAAT